MNQTINHSIFILRDMGKITLNLNHNCKVVAVNLVESWHRTCSCIQNAADHSLLMAYIQTPKIR